MCLQIKGRIASPSPSPRELEEEEGSRDSFVRAPLRRRPSNEIVGSPARHHWSIRAALRSLSADFAVGGQGRALQYLE